MTINIDHLINSVRERLDAMEMYHEKYHNYSWYSDKDHDAFRYSERGDYYGTNYIWDVAQVLGIDMDCLYSIARAARKWEERHNWERCFPAEAHKEQILRYLKKESC